MNEVEILKTMLVYIDTVIEVLKVYYENNRERRFYRIGNEMYPDVDLDYVIHLCDVFYNITQDLHKSEDEDEYEEYDMYDDANHLFNMIIEIGQKSYNYHYAGDEVYYECKAILWKGITSPSISDKRLLYFNIFKRNILARLIKRLEEK